MDESVKKYKERRDSYYSWVSTLPASVQKDARVLAIPESSISTGYLGLCDYKMSFINMSKKTIKYLTWAGRVKNAVGDYVSCEVRHTSSFSGKYTGPGYSLCDYFSSWDALLYNSSADQMVLTSVRIVYTDGSSVTIGKQSLDYLTNIPREVFFDNKYSFIGYGMGSSYEDGVDMDIEIKDRLFLSKSRYERELREEMSLLRDLGNQYKSAKKIIEENRNMPSLLAAYLRNGNVFKALEDDQELIHAVDGYRSLIERSNSFSKRLDEFERAYFGFLNQ